LVAFPIAEAAAGKKRGGQQEFKSKKGLAKVSEMILQKEI
jgi:hypothetical protein